MSAASRRLVRVAAACLTLTALTLVAHTATATSATGPNCGPLAETKADGSAWTCTFVDAFNSIAVNQKAWWVATTASSGFNAGGACFENSTANVNEWFGSLNLTVRKTAPFVCKSPLGNFTTDYTAGEVVSLFSQAYGRFEIRAAFPGAAIPGLQTSIWLWPINSLKYGPWPLSGEIDIAEEYSQYSDRVVPYIHYLPSSFDPNVTNTKCLITNVAAFHTYALEWTPTNLTITFDGKPCISDDFHPAPPLVAPQPFDSPFELALTQSLGTGGDAVTASTPLPATAHIDYVKIWK